ncbi:MAG TPA: hypothetical protein VK612_06400 [Pyrinomonadaceae bacterium]|nr:hypothetical protein [Pyrinomonadaceae bacterium]
MKKILIAIVIAALAASSTLPTSAADDAKPALEKKAPRALPFNGKIAAVDKEAKTVKVGERTFHVTPDTRIMKNAKPATLADATVGEVVGGSYRESDDKKLNLVSLRIGPKPDAAPKKNENAK